MRRHTKDDSHVRYNMDLSATPWEATFYECDRCGHEWGGDHTGNWEEDCEKCGELCSPE
jgi:hypothetical protein